MDPELGYATRSYRSWYASCIGSCFEAHRLISTSSGSHGQVQHREGWLYVLSVEFVQHADTTTGDSAPYQANSTFQLNPPVSGHCSSLLTVTVRRTQRRNMALHSGQEFWQLCYAWSATLRLPYGLEDHSDVLAETKHFIYFYLGHCAILLFKTQ